MLQVYHVSRESFLYLSEFYIGEVVAEDRPLVPMPQGVRPCCHPSIFGQRLSACFCAAVMLSNMIDTFAEIRVGT